MPELPHRFATVRMAVGFLGQVRSSAWWSSSFLSPNGLAIAEYNFPRAAGYAALNATAAAAKKDAVLKALNDKWTALAGSVPGYMTAIQNRIDFLGKKANKKAAAGIDLEAAKSGLADAMSLWSKAQAAFAGGNMDEAVSTAQSVKTQVESLAAALKLDLSAPVAKS